MLPFHRRIHLDQLSYDAYRYLRECHHEVEFGDQKIQFVVNPGKQLTEWLKRQGQSMSKSKSTQILRILKGKALVREIGGTVLRKIRRESDFAFPNFLMEIRVFSDVHIEVENPQKSALGRRGKKMSKRQDCLVVLQSAMTILSPSTRRWRAYQAVREAVAILRSCSDTAPIPETQKQQLIAIQATIRHKLSRIKTSAEPSNQSLEIGWPLKAANLGITHLLT